MALLSQMLGGGMGQQQNPFAQYQQMQANPFTRQIPGTEFLGGMGGGMPRPRMMPSQSNPTDFAGQQSPLPQLPEDLGGFGFGQNAPEMNINSDLRSQLIQQLLKGMMQSQGGMPQGQTMQGGMGMQPMGAQMGQQMPSMGGMGNFGRGF